MKLGEVFRFEVGYRLRRPSTWIYGVLLLGFPFLMLHAVNGSSSHLNSPEKVALLSGISGAVGMLVTAALFGDAATRDLHYRMHPLVYSAPLRKAEYLGGRFLGALAVNAVLLLGVPLGQVAGARMPYLDPRMFGPFQPGAYLQPYLLFLLPNLVLTGAVLFAAAVLSRKTLTAYLCGIGLFIASVATGGARARLASPLLRALADPFGQSGVEELTRYWTPVQRNAQLIGYPAPVLWNRLFWIAVSAAVLGGLVWRFRFAHPGGETRRRKEPSTDADPGPRRATPVAVPAVEGTFGRATRAWQTLAVALRALEETARSRGFLVMLAGLVLFVFLVGWEIGDTVFGTSTWPVTHLVAGTVLGEAVSILMPVLIAIFAGELVWRERDVRMSAIADAAPVPDWAALLGRFLALAALLAAVQAVLMAAGMLLQAVQGYTRFEPGLYLRILFGMKLADYLLFAALAMAVHVVVNQKYLGHLAVILCFLFTLFAARLGIRHHLLVYGTDPGWVYSDLNGFGPFVAPFAWFKLYWAGWALLLGVAARLFWVRGREPGARERLALARARFAGAAARAAGAAALLVVALGGFIFYNTNVLNGYRSPSEADEPRAAYERRYRRFEGLPQPVIVRAELRVEIHPRAAELRGAYRLVNLTGTPIDSVHVILDPDIKARSLSFDRPARRVLADAQVRYAICALAHPLQPGDSLRLAFDLSYRPRGFPNGGIPTAVVANGAYFDRRWLPIVGYQPALELTDAEARRTHGLGPRAAVDAGAARRKRSYLRDADLVDVDAVIGTDGDQIAVTPGTLLRAWRENGRRYVHYRTETPLPFGTPILSGRYAVREDRWRGVDLRIYHHPTHTVNLDRMVRGMKSSLEYYSASWAPYPFRELRIVEFPRYAAFARAHPHTIAFSEGSAFLTRVDSGDVDRTFFVVAHETAHQWWGGAIVGADLPGSALLSETLAQYGAMMVMERMLGPEQARRFYDYEMDNYLRGRRVFSNREVPLLRVESQRYLYYHKGAVAMYTLRERIGEARVNAALRRYLEKNRAGVPPYPTSLDLYAELRAVTPDSLRPLLRDLFEEITLWDVRTDGARMEPLGGGRFRVTLEVEAAKARADSVGTETAVPMDESVEVGVFAAPGKGGGPGEPLYLQRHRVRSGRQTITVIVRGEPARAGIDPYHRLIQREPGDNVVDVESAAGRAGP